MIVGKTIHRKNNQGPMMATTLSSDWSLFSTTHVEVAHFTEGYCTIDARAAPPIAAFTYLITIRAQSIFLTVKP